MQRLPTGTITFLFTDIEGSTKRWEAYPESMKVAVARHDQLMRGIIEAHEGYVFKTIGDAFCAAFPTARLGLAATIAAQYALYAEEWGECGPIRVRMALHTGSADERDNDYFGPTVNRVARLLSGGHGGQILLSLPTCELVRDALPAGATLHDMGQHRLKDLARPEHIFQITLADLPTDFPVLKTLDARPNNLPAQPTPFIGRDRELQAASTFLREKAVRLLTFTGPGGTGKTRLSLQVAANLIEDFEDGVYFSPLELLTDVDQVLASLAQTLSIRTTSDRPLLQSLKEYLRDRHILLVLDNFEQVVAAGPFVTELLAAAPHLKLLVTTRTTLHVYGEQAFPVSPLTTPNPRAMPRFADLGQYEAVQLFVARAQAIKPDLQLTPENAAAIVGICHRLDGLPLAIELAAARIKLFTPQAMLSRLENSLKLLTGGARDLPTRQQTLRGAIDWSYDLLDADEKVLFARMSVFYGATLEAIEAVANADGDLVIDLFDGIESLVNKNLLRQEDQADGESRFVMLATIRDYGLERLNQSGETDLLNQRHAAHYLALAQEAEQHLRGGLQTTWLDRLEAEHDNLRAALRLSIEQGAADDGLRIGTALLPFWEVRGHWGEGRQLLESLLALSGANAEVQGYMADAGTGQAMIVGVPTVLRAKALVGAGTLALRQGDLTRARTLYAESLAIGQVLNNPREIASALNSLATVHQRQGDYAEAYRLYEETLQIRRQLNDRKGIAASLNNLANLTYRQGDYVRAKALYEESLVLRRALNDRGGVAASLNNLGNVSYRQGDLARAAFLFEEGLAVRRALGDRPGIASMLNNLANVRHKQGDQAQATAFYEESLDIKRELGDQLGMAYSLHGLGSVAFMRGDHDRARVLYTESLVLTWKLGDKWGVAQALEDLARLANTQGHLERALRLAAASAGLQLALGAVSSAAEQITRERWLDAAHAALGDTAAAVWAAGQAAPLEQLVSEALGEGVV